MFAHARWDLLERFEVNDEIVFDSENSIGCKPRVILWIDLRHYCLVVWVRDL